MTRVILQPTGSPSAREHYRDTIANPVVFRDFTEAAGSDLTTLESMFPGGQAALWGVTPGKSNATKWDRAEPGDIVLFAAKKMLFARGEILLKFHNEAFAEALWGRDEQGQTWEYMYALGDIKSLNYSYVDLNRAVGYADNNVVQGFQVLDEEKSSLALARLDLSGGLPIQPEKIPEPPKLNIGSIYSWDDLARSFEFKANYLGAAGGIPVSTATNSVLVITHPGGGKSFNYGDYWDGNDLIYIGRGKNGDQKLTGPNLAIADNLRMIFAFEASGSKALRFLGNPKCEEKRLTLAPGDDGSMRRVFEFRLRFPGQAPFKSHAAESETADKPRRSNKVERALRTPRKVDRDSRPTTYSSAGVVLDYTQIAVLQEKAQQSHHDMLVALDERLALSNWTDIEETPSATDLWGTAPSGQRVIFELKTITDKNETSQCRSALAQLLEYRLIDGKPSDLLCLVVNSPITQHRARVLDRLGVGVIVQNDESVTAANDAGSDLLPQITSTDIQNIVQGDS